MKTRRQFRTALIISVTILAMTAWMTMDARGAPPSPEDAVQRALRRVEAAGSYRFTADVEQTMVPRPLPEMIGQRSQHFDLRLNGEALLPDYVRMEIDAEAIAGMMDDRGSLKIIQTEDGAFIEVNGELQPVDSAYAMASTTGDYLEFLAAAHNVQPLDETSPLTGLSFEIDGQRLAEFYRDQTEAALRANGELPDQIALGLSPALLNTTGSGELWLDEDGLPQRLVLALDQPEVSREYGSRAHIVMDFSAYGEVDTVARPVQDQNGTWRLKMTSGGPSARGTVGDRPRLAIRPQPDLLFLLALICAATLLIALYHRHRRHAYLIIVSLVIVSTISSPLLQALRITRFLTTHAQAAPLGTAEFEVAAVTAEREIASAVAAYRPITSRSTTTTQTDQQPPDIRCGAGDPNTDTDGDGISDRDENCLGTDYAHVDSDRDGITDTLELDGVEWPAGSGQMWYGDPFKADTNNDGLLDTYEWPEPYGEAPEWDIDGDGVPNPWDNDSDGDGVPDGLDLAPYVYTEYAESFSLSIRSDEFDGYAFIELQVQPQNPDHLRYSLSTLDWPYDDLGQIRDLDNSKEDLRLTPVLEIQTNVAPDKTLAAEYGVTVFENEDDADYAYTLYAALFPMDDGGRITAFAAKVAYEPEKLDEIRWEKTRLVWIAQMENDTWSPFAYEAGWRRRHIIVETLPLNTYIDTFRVTGLQISIGREFESAILGTPNWPNDDRTLFQAALAVGATFMSYQTPTLDDVIDRFANPDPNADPLTTWGVHPTNVAEDAPVTYANRDEGMIETNHRLRDFLDRHGYGHGSNPSLLTVMQEEVGAWAMGEGASAEIPAAFSLNLNSIALATQRTVKLTTYAHEEGDWQPMTIADSLHLMQERYDTDSLEPVRDGLADDYPDLTTADLQATVLTFYTAWLNGRNKVSKVDGDDLFDPAPDDLDQQTYDDVHLPAAKYDNLSAYLLEAAELGEPGGGFRLGGSPAQAWEYQRAHAPKVDAFSFTPVEMANFYAHVEEMPDLPLPSWTMLAALSGVKSAFALRTWHQMKDIVPTPLNMDKLSNHKLGAMATGASLIIIWIAFAGTENLSNPFVLKTALAYAFANTVFTLITFAMSFFPGFTAVLWAFFLVDLIVLLVTWGGTSMTGEVIKWISRAFYEVRTLTSLDNIDFKDARGEMKNEAQGMIAGNSYTILQTFEGLLDYTADADADDIRDSTVYAWFEPFSDSADATGARGDTECYKALKELEVVNFPFSNIFSTFGPFYKSVILCTNETRAKYHFDQPGRNIRLQIDTRVHARTYYEECGLWGASCDRTKMIVDLPEDLSGDTRRRWQPMELYVDVLPGTVTDLWSWEELHNSDRDADGLSNDHEADLGTDPDLWDTDGDGLSDKFELDNQETLGCDPLDADTDGDGLSDGLEYRLGTGIDQPDSDDDGLLDGEEVFHLVTDPDTGDTGWAGGWWVDGLPESERAYWVYSDPLQADADDDGLNDKAERAYGTSPYAYNEAPRLEMLGDPLATSPSGGQAAYLEPGDPLTLTFTLDSSGPDPISATVTLCLPNFVTDLQGGQIQGDRTPPRDTATGCDDDHHGFQWDFTGAHTLHNWERISTTVTAVAAGVASAHGQAVVSFPYPMGDDVQEIEDRIALALDNEAPTARFSAPGDGEIIGGGVSDYVVGGNAGDATSWVDHVSVDLPGAGAVTAEGENPWAYTWELPADGVYDLTATAHDYLGYTSTPAIVQVTVDNTPPTATLDLADGEHVAAEVGGVITITLTGTASDNLSGLTHVQVSLDDKPWREVWQGTAYPLSAPWSEDWTLPNEASASGEHVVRVRALDRAGNASEVLERTIIVDVLPPTAEMGDRIYAQTFAADPPHVQVGETLDLYGVANDVGNVPAPSRPKELLGALDGLYDATIWLGLPTVKDNDDGVALAWVGDFNNDRLADLALGLPAAEDGAGRVTLVYGRAGDWPAPEEAAPIAKSRTSLVGADGAHIGAHLAFAGDANGDGLADLLVGDPNHRRAFLIFGSTQPLGRDVRLADTAPQWSVLSRSDDTAFGARIASAGDVNGDGLADLLLGAGEHVYLLLGQPSWREEVYADQMAAVQVNAGSSSAQFAALGDVDGDQYDDWAVASDDTVYLFLGHDDLASSPPHPQTLELSEADATFSSDTTDPQIVALGDVDGDGLADWLYQSGDTPILVFGSADETWRTHTFSFDPPASGFLAAPGDVDGDDLADVLLGNANGDAYLVLGANLDAVQATLTGVDAAASAPYAAGADLNSDGSSDLLLLPAQPADTGVSRATVSMGTLDITAPASLPVRNSAPSFDRTANRARTYAPSGIQAITRYVNDDAGCEGQSPCYTTIQAAVDAAGAGDTIHIQPGAYASFIVEGKDDLTLSGAHPDAVFVDGAGGPYAAKIKDATGVSLAQMTLRDAENAIELENAGVDGDKDPALLTQLQYVLIYDFGAHALSMNRASTVELSRCTLAGGKDHIAVTGDPAPAPDPAWSDLSPTGTPAGDGSGGGLAAADGKLYAALNAGDDALDVYDPSADAWSSRTPMPVLRTQGATEPAAANDALYVLPGSIWEAMGDGFGGGALISDTATLGDSVYFVGQFTQVGGVAVNHLARWDGSQWYDVGGGVTKSGGGARLNSVAVDSSGNLYVAGDFDQAGGISASRIAMWDGSQWHALDTLPAVPAAVGVDGEDTLYAGSCKAIPGGANSFWQWDGNAWAEISTAECIHDLATDPEFADRIAVAGWLVSSSAAGGYTNVGRYRGSDGSWQKIGWDVSGPAYVLEMIVGEYYNRDSSQFIIGGDFTITNRGVTTRNIAHWWYGCTDGACYWHLTDMGGGTDDVVHSLAWEGRKFSNIYVGGDFAQTGSLSATHIARWDGGAWHAVQQGSSQGSSQGTDAPVTALAWHGSRLYAAGGFTQAGGVSAAQVAQWHHPLYRYDIAEDTWQRLASVPQAQALGDGSSLVADGAERLYAIPGSDSPQIFRYDITSDAWTQGADAPATFKIGATAALARGLVYALRGANTRSFYRYDPATDDWATVSDIPETSGVASAGASIVFDGGNWLYATLGGSGKHFLRYSVTQDEWEILGDGSSGTSDDHDTPAEMNDGGGLARVGTELYAIPGGGSAALWRFGPLDEYRDKLRLDHVAFTVQETATQGDWYNLSLDEPPPDFGVSGESNVWVGGAATAWSPSPTTWPASNLDLGQPVTHTRAAFLDPDRNLYRLTASSVISAGYTTYHPDVRVPEDYASIQDAILSGANRVLVDDGQYAQAFHLLSGVEVLGPRADRAQLTPPPGHTGPLVTAEGVTGATVKGFTLNGADGVVGVRAEGGTEHVTLARNILRNTTTAIEAHGAATQLEVVNNTIVENGAGMAASDCAPLDVRNTIFAYNDGAGLAFDQGCDDPGLHAYNLYWANGADLDPAEPGPAELFLDPRFVDRLAHNYTTDDYSPVIDAGSPTDPHPPATGETIDIGYIEQGRAAYYVDDDYCAGGAGRVCLNDGLTWGVDAYASIQEALDVAREEQLSYGRETAGDIACRIYHSADTPQEIISSTRAVEVFSGIDVPHGGHVVDVNVHNVRGTHDRVSDLDVILESPSGIMARLFAPATCDQADFDLNFDDEAASGSPPCPPDDGGDYQPAQALSKYDGDEAAGTWVLHVRDVVTGTGGRLDAWGLEICSRQTPPPLTVGVGPGAYTETLSVPSYVRLIGVDPDTVTLDTQGAGVPVTFDGVVHAEVSGFTITGNDGGVGVLARGTSKEILISRNLIRDNWHGVGFIEGTTGAVRFNTVGNHEFRGSNGVYAAGAGSQVAVENTIVRNYTNGLYAYNSGLIFSDHNLLVENDDHFNPDTVESAYDQTTSNAGFVGGGDFHITQGSPALDSASPHVPVPPGGGERPDIGYHELTALPVTVLLGKEGTSTAIGAAGLSKVESAVVSVGDPRTPPNETAPDTWQTVYSDADASAIKATWQLNATPATAGLHRIYSRAEDGVGNRAEDVQTWYIGAFVADDTAPTVTWIAPTPGPVSTTVSTTIELRAQAWDEVAGQFSVEQVQFEIDGQSTPAAWAAEPWDPAAGQPRTFRAWITLTLGTSPSVVAVAYDKAGNRGASAPLQLNVTSAATPDTISPTLTVLSPTSGSGVQPPVVFQGTVTDTGGSGVASVEVSLDNGITWLPAAVAGEQWSLTWHPPWRQDYVTYPALVRAADKAGNRATEAVTFAIDNVPPTIDTRYGYRTHFFKEANPLHGRDGTHPGEHLDTPTEITIWAGWPWDGSDVGGDSLRYQYAVDQNPNTLPDLDGEWLPRPKANYLPTEWFTLPGEWYVHLFYRDQADNIAIQRYGPWHMGNYANTLVDCNSRVQTIELDGYLDVANYEWTEREFLDDDERGMAQGHERQSLYASWDSDAFYVGWQGAWWDVDGEMWVYLDTAPASADKGTNYTVETPHHALPFKADQAIRVTGQGAVTLYESWEGRWWPKTYGQGSHDVSGGTEVKFPIGHDLTTIQDIRLLAYARDNDDQVWAMFPTTNPLEGAWEAYYHWNTVCDPLVPINDNQPKYISIALWVIDEVSQSTFPPIGLGSAGLHDGRTMAASTSSEGVSDGFVGPGSQITYTIHMENRETYTTPVTTLEVFSPVGLDETVLIPPLRPGEDTALTLTQTMPDDLSGLTTLPFSVTLNLSDTVLAQDWLSYRVDNLPPMLTLANQIVCPGAQTLSGRASDGDGGGISAVRLSLDERRTWQDVVGSHNWTAQVTVPAGAETLTVWLRAVDVFGQAIELPFTLRTDTDAPALMLSLPDYLTGNYGNISGVASDVSSWIERVEVQLGDESAPWQAGEIYRTSDGPQNWAFTWSLPQADGVPLPIRARVVDAGCNLSPETPWMSVPIDNVPPVIQTTQVASVVPLEDYLADGTGDPVLTGTMVDGSGIISASVTLVDPAGHASVIPLTPASDAWAFTPRFTEGLYGRYTMRVEAVDAAGNRSISRRFEVRATPVSLKKSVQPSADVPLGDVVTYTLALHNHSKELLAGTVITDPLPAEVTPITQTEGPAFSLIEGNTLAWGPFDVASGETLTLSFTARVTPDTRAYGADVMNTAYVSAPDMASIPSAPATFTIEAELGIDIYLPLVTKGARRGNGIYLPLVARH